MHYFENLILQLNKQNKQAHATDACASRCILIFLFTPVFAWANGVSCLEDLGKIVVVGDSAKKRDFIDGKLGGAEQLAGVGQPAFFDVLRRGAIEVFLEDVVDLAV